MMSHRDRCARWLLLQAPCNESSHWLCVLCEWQPVANRQ